MARKTTTIPVFVVRKHHWWYNDEYEQPIDSNAILTFRDREKAEQYRQELERKARRGEDDTRDYYPFNMLDPRDTTIAFDPEQFATTAEALGLERPDPFDLHNWWHNNHRNLTPDQREALWALFDHISFYEVVADTIEVRS